MTWLNLDSRALLNSIYSFKRDERAWADQVLENLGPLMDFGQGTLVTLVRFSEQGLRLGYIRRREAHPIHTAVLKLSAFLVKKKLREAFFNGRVIGASQGFYEDGAVSALQDGARRVGSRDALGFCVNDTTDAGLMIVGPSNGQICLNLNQQAILKKLGAHVSNALRLQRVVASLQLDDPASEAVFGQKGARAEHLHGMAREKEQLDELSKAVEAFRHRRRSTEHSERLDATHALISGRWSLVHRFDTDGKEFIVAYRNPEGVLDTRRLSEREQDVITMVALGQSNKEVASSLGVSTSTVGSLLSGAMQKLNIRSRTQIPQFWRATKGRAWPLGNLDGSFICIENDSDEENEVKGKRLTPAERFVAAGIVNGQSRKMIAEKRGVSPRTIDKQTEAIYRKLNIQSRTELATLIFGSEQTSHS